jgi:hypothetical protein
MRSMTDEGLEAGCDEKRRLHTEKPSSAPTSSGHLLKANA